MKIGILTQPLASTYGGILQNFALQHILRRMGHTPVTINHVYTPMVEKGWRNSLRTMWRFVKRWLLGDRSVLFYDVTKQVNFYRMGGAAQRKFVEENISVVNAEFPLQVALASDYDAFMVGSDQVWRPRYSPALMNFYLDFAVDADVKRVAYAASFGVDEWELDERLTRQARALAQRFDAISVRESSGVELCRRYLGVEAEVVLDPTMLLNIEEYVQVLNLCTKPRCRYVAVYILDKTKDKQRVVDSVCRQLNCKPLYLDVLYGNGTTIKEWIEGIYNSEYVVTDSFHGTVFSILSHKGFTSIVNKGRGATRFDSLLGICSLKERAIECSDELRSSGWQHKIDYTAVDAELERYRERSVSFIKESLYGARGGK